MRDYTLSFAVHVLGLCGSILGVCGEKLAGEGVFGILGGGELKTTRSGIGGQGSSSQAMPSLVPMAGTLF